MLSSRNHRSELGPEPEGAMTGPSGPLRVPPDTVTGTVWDTAASTAASAGGLTFKLPPLRAGWQPGRQQLLPVSTRAARAVLGVELKARP